MSRSVCNLDGHSLQLILRASSYTTIAGLLVSANQYQVIKILSQLSQKQKDALMFELEGSGWFTKEYLEQVLVEFWETVDDMARRGETS